MKNIAIFVVGFLFGVFIMYLGGMHAPQELIIQQIWLSVMQR